MPQINGLVTSVSILKRGLEEKNNDVYIVAPSVPGFKKKDEKIINVPSIPFIFLPEYRNATFFSLKLFNLISKIKFDVIHTHTPFFLGILGMYMGKIFHIPLVHTYHTYFEEYLHYVKLPSNIGISIVKYFSQWYCNKMDSIIVPSYFMSKILRRYNIKNDINIIPTGIDIKEFQKVDYNKINIWKDKLKLKRDDNILLYVGRLAKEKNLYFLIDIFSKLSKIYKNIKLLMIGDGPEHKHLKHYAIEKKVDSLVIFTGYIKRDEIKYIYHLSNIFVFPSLTETQGLVLLEAMATGLPIVSFYKRGTTAVLPDEKIEGISSVLDENSFFKEIIFYLEYKNKEKIKKNLKEYVKKFDYQVMTDNILNIYKKV